MELSDSPILVSIALTTYNGEKYLPVLLDSLLAQTYPHLEIIAVDDRSTDRTFEILQQYSLLHPHIKVYVNESNLGFIKNFEKAISLCNGEYIAMCDQDDYWLPENIERKVEEIGEYPMIYCDSFIANENLEKTGKKISDALVCKTYTNCLNYAVFSNVYGHAWMFRRSLYLSAPIFPLFITHDWWLAYNGILKGGVKFLPEALALYRQHDKNQFGVLGGGGIDKKTKRQKKKNNKKKINKQKVVEDARERLNLFYDICPDDLQKEKKVLYNLKKSYSSFSLSNNFLRMITFFKNYKLLLAVRKRNAFRKYLFCLKMFVKLK
jgi:glycosyltransferase involved in cell wall biosynthesis